MSRKAINKEKKKAALAAQANEQQSEENATLLSLRQRVMVLAIVLPTWAAAFVFAGATIAVYRDYADVGLVLAWTIYFFMLVVYFGIPATIIALRAVVGALLGRRSSATDEINRILPSAWVNTEAGSSRRDELEAVRGDNTTPATRDNQSPTGRFPLYIIAALCASFMLVGIAIAPFPALLRIGLYLAATWLIVVNHFLLASYRRADVASQIDNTIMHLAASSLTNAALLAIGCVAIYLSLGMSETLGCILMIALMLSTAISGWWWAGRILGDPQAISFDDAFFEAAALGNIPMLAIGMPSLFIYLYAS